MLTELIFWVILTVILYNLIVLVVEQINIGGIQDKAVVISGTDTGFGNGLMYKCLENGMTVFAGFLTEEVGMDGLVKKKKGVSFRVERMLKRRS